MREYYEIADGKTPYEVIDHRNTYALLQQEQVATVSFLVPHDNGDIRTVDVHGNSAVFRLGWDYENIEVNNGVITIHTPKGDIDFIKIGPEADILLAIGIDYEDLWNQAFL